MAKGRRALAGRMPPGFPTGVVVVAIALSLLGGVVAPNDPYAQDLAHRLTPPSWMEGGSLQYLLGTDQLGRDIFSRIIAGTQASVIVGIFGVIAGALLGSVAGLIGGYLGGFADALVMRLVDAFLSVPIILFAVLLAIVMEPGIVTVVIAAAIAIWARFARVVRGEVLSLRERPFIESARAIGAKDWRMMTKHLLPNLWATIITLASLQVGSIIILEASLSFLGAGVPPPTPAWGSMIANGRLFLANAWWIATFPGCAVLLLVVSTNLLGDWLRDVLDPSMRT